jgi:hypothetical protein
MRVLLLLVGLLAVRSVKLAEYQRARGRIPPPGAVAQGAKQGKDDLDAHILAVDDARTKRGQRVWPSDLENMIGDSFAPPLNSERPGGLVVDLTQRLREVSGRVHSRSSEAERLAALDATHAVFLQLQHAVAQVGMKSTQSAWDSGDNAKCFSCLYLLQRAIHDSAPFYSPLSHASEDQFVSGEPPPQPHGAERLPISFPTRSAYASKNVPVDMIASEYTGRHPPGEPAALNGRRYESLSQKITTPPSNAPPTWWASGDKPILDKRNWPLLHFSDNEESLLQTMATERQLNWGNVPEAAYLYHLDNPRIGPKVPPPIPVVPNAPIRHFMTMGQEIDPENPKVVMPPIDYLPPADEPPQPPMIAAHAVVERLREAVLAQRQEAEQFRGEQYPRVPYSPLNPATDQPGSPPPFFTDAHSVSMPPPASAQTYPLTVVPALLQTGGTPDEVAATRSDAGKVIDPETGSGDAQWSPQRHPSLDGVSYGPDSNTETQGYSGLRTSSLEGEDEVFNRISSGAPDGPNPVALTQPGPPTDVQKKGKGMLAKVGAALGSLFGKKRDPRDPYKRERKALLENQKAVHAAQPPASPERWKNGPPPIEPSYDGGEGFDRFDPPDVIARLKQAGSLKLEKYGKWKKSKKVLPPIGLPAGNQEAGLWSDPVVMQDSANIAPVLVGTTDELQALVHGEESLLQRRAETARRARVGAQGIGDTVKQQLERLRPLPHACRSGESVCRQRLRLPSKYAMTKLIRRASMRQWREQLISEWGRALRLICSPDPPIGQALPPRGEEEFLGTTGGQTAEELQHIVSSFLSSGSNATDHEDEAAPSQETEHSPSTDPVEAAVDALHEAITPKSPEILKNHVSPQELQALKQPMVRALNQEAALFAEKARMTSNPAQKRLAEDHRRHSLQEAVNFIEDESPFARLKNRLEAFDRQNSPRANGPGAPPRLQSEGLDSQGRVSSQPFTGYITESNKFGDRAAVGQMPDFGLPDLIRQHCNAVADKLKLITDLYLHRYDLEQVCSLSDFCRTDLFGVIGATKPTTIAAKLLS